MPHSHSHGTAKILINEENARVSRRERLPRTINNPMTRNHFYFILLCLSEKLAIWLHKRRNRAKIVKCVKIKAARSHADIPNFLSFLSCFIYITLIWEKKGKREIKFEELIITRIGRLYKECCEHGDKIDQSLGRCYHKVKIMITINVITAEKVRFSNAYYRCPERNFIFVHHATSGRESLVRLFNGLASEKLFP